MATALISRALGSKLHLEFQGQPTEWMRVEDSALGGLATILEEAVRQGEGEWSYDGGVVRAWKERRGSVIQIEAEDEEDRGFVCSEEEAQVLIEAIRHQPLVRTAGR